LETEFQEDLEGASGGEPYRARLESVYTRGTEISGEPLSLSDGYTFGQTLINDFGRPYERGFNSVTGFSAWTTAGRWVGYVRGEYQHSPAAPPLSDSARSTIAAVDPFPKPPATPISSVNQFQLLDAYVGLNFNNWQATFGQYGQFLDPQPFIHGQMFSFKPTHNFEFAFFRTTIYGGPGYPLTFHHLLSSLFTTGNEVAGGASKPGDRRSGLSFSYRLPGLR